MLPSSGVQFKDSINETDLKPDGVTTDGGFEATDPTGTSTLDPSGLQTTGDAECENLIVNGTATLKGLVTAEQKISGTDSEFSGFVKATSSYKLGTDVFTAVEIERCDGKKMKVLATGWI